MDNSLSMKCPKGNQFSKNRKEYYHEHKASRLGGNNDFYRKVIHGLPQRNNYNTLWSRDCVASLNICHSFVSCFQTKAAAHYLQPNR